jgi:hypothetical protein
VDAGLLRREFEALQRELDDLRRQLDHVGRLRLDVARLQSRLRALTAALDEEATPVRPPSDDARKAFESSSRFLAVKPPKKL